MKSKLLIPSLLILFVLGLMGESSAQIRDSLFWFKAPSASDFSGDVSSFKGAFALTDMRTANLKSISAPQAAQLQMPRKVKRIPNNIVLRKGNLCYRVGCATGNGCSNCNMYWWDRNGDRKIQPRKELRCVCSDGKKKCKVRAQAIKCK